MLESRNIISQFLSQVYDVEILLTPITYDETIYPRSEGYYPKQFLIQVDVDSTSSVLIGTDALSLLKLDAGDFLAVDATSLSTLYAMLDNIALAAQLKILIGY